MGSIIDSERVRRTLEELRAIGPAKTAFTASGSRRARPSSAPSCTEQNEPSSVLKRRWPSPRKSVRFYTDSCWPPARLW